LRLPGVALDAWQGLVRIEAATLCYDLAGQVMLTPFIGKEPSEQ
jgi:hypothetical protein